MKKVVYINSYLNADMLASLQDQKIINNGEVALKDCENLPVFIGGSYTNQDKLFPFMEIIRNKYHSNTCVDMAQDVASTYGDSDERTIAYKVALKRRDHNILAAPALDMDDVYSSQFVSINPLSDMNDDVNVKDACLRLMNWPITEEMQEIAIKQKIVHPNADIIAITNCSNMQRENLRNIIEQCGYSFICSHEQDQ